MQHFAEVAFAIVSPIIETAISEREAMQLVSIDSGLMLTPRKISPAACSNGPRYRRKEAAKRCASVMECLEDRLLLSVSGIWAGTRTLGSSSFWVTMQLTQNANNSVSGTEYVTEAGDFQVWADFAIAGTVSGTKFTFSETAITTQAVNTGWFLKTGNVQIAANSMSGAWSGSGQSGPLNLTRAAAPSVDVSGYWQGSFTQVPVGGDSKYTDTMSLSQSGAIVTGTETTAEVSAPQYYADFNVTGVVIGSIFTVQELTITKQNVTPGSYWFHKTLSQRVATGGLSMSGNWYDDGYIGIYTLTHLPTMPNLISPAASDIVGLAPTFTVSATDPSGLSLYYQIEMRGPTNKNGIGNSDHIWSTMAGEGGKYIQSFASGSTATITVPVDFGIPYGQGTWRVRAINSKGVAGPWSGTRAITYGGGIDAFTMPTLAASAAWKAAKAAGAGYYIADAFMGVNVNPNTAAQLAATRQNGLATAAYAVLNFNSKYAPADDGASQMSLAINAIGSSELSHLNFMAIDIESNATFNVPGNIMQPADAAKLIASAISKFQSVSKAPIFIYAGSTFWNSITGSSKAYANYPLWQPTGSTTNADLDSAFSTYGGWSKRTAKQYLAQSNNLGLSNIDFDVFDPSLFKVS